MQKLPNERLYENNVKGKVSDSSFERLSLKYETERDELKMKIKDIRVEYITQSKSA